MDIGDILYFFALFIVFYILTDHFLHKIRNLPPTPFPSLPFIGHLYLLNKPIYRSLAKISEKYGPVVFLRFGSRPIIVVSSPSAAEECLTKNDIVFANRPHLLISKCFGNNNTNLVWSPYGDHWRSLRRISTVELLSTHRLNALSAIRVDEVKSLIRRLAMSENRVVNMRHEFYDLTFNVMMRMIAGKRFYGEEVSDEDKDEAKMFREMQVESARLSGKSNIGDFVPVMRWMGFGSELEKKMMVCQKRRDGFMKSLIEQHRERRKSKNGDSYFGDGRKKTMIEVLLELQASEPKIYDDDTIIALMLVLLLAGTETSGNVMEWTLSLLLNHPEFFKKAQAEIDDRIGFDRLIEESDMAHLPYLRGIIKETFRMFPPAPLMVPHESSDDCTVRGYRIPRGTILYVNLWAIQNDPKIWTDPRKFDPERFDNLESEKFGFNFNLMPFGSGRRGCPGEGLGLRVVGLVLGSLIQCFEWEKPNDELVDMTEGIAVTMPKAKNLQAKCKPRPNMVNLLSLAQ